MNNVIEPGACHWCGKHCGGTCLKLTESTQMKTSDPAYWMLKDGHRSTPTIHRDGCYICDDPEFAAMGLPLCRRREPWAHPRRRRGLRRLRLQRAGRLRAGAGREGAAGVTCASCYQSFSGPWCDRCDTWPCDCKDDE
jgi:hypothetical protein